MSSKFALTAQEEAEKINSQVGSNEFGMSLVTDQEHWEKLGISTGEELAISVLRQTYSDLFKELYGFRPRDSRVNTVDGLTTAINDLDRRYADMRAMEEIEAKEAAEYEKERAELAAMMPREFDYQELPKYSGMGRRDEGVDFVKITKRQLRRIIKEEKAKLFKATDPPRGYIKNQEELEQWADNFTGRERGDDNLRSTARIRKALESGELDWLDDFKSSAVMRHLEQMGKQ